MKENMLRNLCNKIDYNTYKKMRILSLFPGFGLNTMLLFTPSASPSVVEFVNSTNWVGPFLYLAMTFSGGDQYTKDILEIRELYEEFIKNYNELNKLFALSDPIEIHTMFTYLLYEGYLSKDKEFQFSQIDVRDIESISGVNVMNGQGVCRHISAMLTDILNDYGIESIQLMVDYGDRIRFDDVIKTPEEYSEGTIDYVRTCITNIPNYDAMKGTHYVVIREKGILNKLLGNHRISFAFKDGKLYFLDPTQNKIYRIDKFDKRFLYDEESLLKIIPLDLLFSSYHKHMRMKELLNGQHQSISIEEEKRLTTETMKLCNENGDIFERFYSENSELYDDISSKVLQIKRGIF